MRRMLPAVALLLLCVAGNAIAREEGEDRPRIFLEKRVYFDTVGGEKVYFESHTVTPGESLWKILAGRSPLTPGEYAEALREFRKLNPGLADPGRLHPGQKVMVPVRAGVAAREDVDRGTAVARQVRKGDTVMKLLRAQGVGPKEMGRYLAAVRSLNRGLRNLNRILAGQTVYVPTARYFVPAETPTAVARAEKEAAPDARPAPVPGPPSAPEAAAPADGAAPASPPAPADAPPVQTARAREIPPAPADPPPVPAPAEPAGAPEATDASGVSGASVAAPQPAAAPPAPVPSPEAASAPREAAAPDVPAPSPAPAPPAAREEAPVAGNPPAQAPSQALPGPELTAPVRPSAEEPEDAPAKPDAQLAAREGAAQGGGSTATVPGAGAPETAPQPPPKPPYRGLLVDIVTALGERWMDNGSLYLPIPSGGEVVLDMADFPVVRFGTGAQAIMDFRGGISPEVRSMISEVWEHSRTVEMDGTKGPLEMIDRLLAAAGYASVRDGLARPLVIGEQVAVTLPARWVVFRTRQNLDAGDVTLIKEVPERPTGELDAVLTCAGRVGVRVLPFAADPVTREGFLAGLEDRPRPDAPPSNTVPAAGGLAAVDASLRYLGIPSESEPTLKIAGKDDAFRLTIRPERVFAAGGKKYVVDTGRLSPAIRELVKSAGYVVFPVSRTEGGASVFLRLYRTTGGAYEERRGFVLAGGEKAGYAVRATGTFLTSGEILTARGVRAVVLVRGRIHSAMRTLLKGLGVEIVEVAS